MLNGQDVEIIRKIDTLNSFYIISADIPVENQQYPSRLIFESKFIEILCWQIDKSYERDDRDDKIFTEKLCYEVNEKYIYSITSTYGQ